MAGIPGGTNTRGRLEAPEEIEGHCRIRGALHLLNRTHGTCIADSRKTGFREWRPGLEVEILVQRANGLAEELNFFWLVELHIGYSHKETVFIG